MIIATVMTCPQRWGEYTRLRKQFDALRMGFPLRTFQTEEYRNDPRRNSNLNGRAAIGYCVNHLSQPGDDWMLFLEDDVDLKPELVGFLGAVTEGDLRGKADCWYLCNRKGDYQSQFSCGEWILNELKAPICGSHAVLFPASVLPRLLEPVWDDYLDRVMFRVLERVGARVLQVVSPVVAVHRGEVSTYAPHRRTRLEVNHANSCYNH